MMWSMKTEYNNYWISNQATNDIHQNESSTEVQVDISKKMYQYFSRIKNSRLIFSYVRGYLFI
jgi:hypothetical protein